VDMSSWGGYMGFIVGTCVGIPILVALLCFCTCRYLHSPTTDRYIMEDPFKRIAREAREREERERAQAGQADPKQAGLENRERQQDKSLLLEHGWVNCW
jgi:hypothetical protein